MEAKEPAGPPVGTKRARLGVQILPSALKLLLSAREAACAYGPGGAALREIQRVTGATLSFSGDDCLYPGTSLHEVVVQGKSCEVVLDAAIHALQTVLDTLGYLGGGDPDVQPGTCRVRVVVPARGAKAIIGVKGAAVEQMRQETGMHVHVDGGLVPPGAPGDLSEQTVCLNGPLSGLHMAIMTILAHLVPLASEPWFSTWAAHSHCGLQAEGLARLENQTKGKGRGKLKADATVADVPHASTSSTKRGVAVKLLVSPKETSALLGKGGERIRAISQATGAAMQMSQRDKFYPGTHLQELKVIGPTEAVVLAAQYALGQIHEQLGVLACGEENVDQGDARIRMVVPSAVARAIIGKGGENIRQVREHIGMHVHIDETAVPYGTSGHLFEQVVCFNGPISGAAAAVSATVAQLSSSAAEPWFESWASGSNCGTVIPGLVLTLDRQLAAAKAQSRASMGNLEFVAANGELAGNGVEASRAGPMADSSELLAASAAVAAAAQELNLMQVAAAAQAAAQQAIALASSVALASEAVAKSGANLFVAVKVLVAQDEAQCLLGQDGSTLSEIQATTSTSMKLSDGHYPGSSLRELTVQGMSKEAVLLAITYILTVIVELLGWMCSGEANVEPGGARLKLVVPAKVAASIIGVGGASVKQICHQCAVRVQVDQSPVPCGRGVTEQAVLLSGMGGAVQSALPLVFEHVALIAQEKDLYAWAAHSNAGTKIAGFTLFSGMRKGKSRGGFPHAGMG